MKSRTIEHTIHTDEGWFTVTARITPPLYATYLDPPEPADIEIEHIECANPDTDPNRVIEILGGEDAIVAQIMEYLLDREEGRRK